MKKLKSQVLCMWNGQVGRGKCRNWRRPVRWSFWWGANPHHSSERGSLVSISPRYIFVARRSAPGCSTRTRDTHPTQVGQRTVSSDYIASAITSLTRFSAERPQSLVTGARGGVQACRDATSRGNIDKRRAPRNSVRPSVGRSIEI